MNQKQMILRSIVVALFCIIANHSTAQQSNVDSIITLIQKSKTEKGLDTLAFNSARGLITNTVLTDIHINQIENAAEILKNRTDEDLCYVIKVSILGSLTTSDKNKAIDYGRLNLEKLEKSKTPHSKLLRISFLTELRLPYRNSGRLPEGFQFYTETLNRYKKNTDSSFISTCYYVLGGFYRTTGLMDLAIYNMKKSVSYLDTSKTAEKSFFNLQINTGWRRRINNASVVGEYYLQKGDLQESVNYTYPSFKSAMDYYNQFKGDKRTLNILLFHARTLAMAKTLQNKTDSVEYFLNISDSAMSFPPNYTGLAYILQLRSLYKMQIGSLSEADSLLQQCWQMIDTHKIGVNTFAGIVAPDYYLALVRIKQDRHNDAIDLLIKDIVRVNNIRLDVLRDYKLLAELYEKTGNKLKAKDTYKAFISLQDSILADQNKYRTISFETEQQMNEKELSIAKLESQNKISSLSRNFSIGIATLLLLIVAGVYNRFRTKKRANLILEETLSNLKSTQSQLIQSEKMASLGELTAGIAHEIQNPLNFVNNFSEVNKELLVEMKDEMNKGNLAEAIALANDVMGNEEKINHHGKRADAIVKGMLQHSRTSTGQKEPTDINALADEYLRLAYHGLRAKDKTFNATMKTDFDGSIGKINVIAQDMGRVMLNLITNAFYACTDRNRMINAEKIEQKYEPTVTIITRKQNGKVEISVKDNGNGIPQKVLDKIFQPFFTTKPAGQGTGLGLSLAYDIIKTHGGELTVETKEGEGAIFIIRLPV